MRDINPILPYVDGVLYLVDGHFRVGTVDQVMTAQDGFDVDVAAGDGSCDAAPHVGGRHHAGHRWAR